MLRAITGKHYVLAGSPDETNRRGRDIDFLFAIVDTRAPRVAAEHTIVESYERQIRYVNIAHNIGKEIDSRCRGALPEDRYFYLAIPDRLIHELEGRARETFISDMRETLPATCAGLQLDKYTKVPYRTHEILVKCEGRHPDINGHIFHMQLTPASVESLSTKRMSRSLTDKLPKLIRYKLQFFRTALLIEDISGSAASIARGSRSLSILQKLAIWLFVDYLVEFASNENEMIVGNVWKEGLAWHKIVPYRRRYAIDKDQDGRMTVASTD